MAKANMSLTRNAMPVQDALVRAHNFDEVALGYTEEQAIDEANRCLNCKICLALTVVPLKFTSPSLFPRSRKATSSVHIRSLQNHPLFPQYAAEFVRRKHSANLSVSEVSRESPLVSVALSVSLPIGTTPSVRKNP